MAGTSITRSVCGSLHGCHSLRGVRDILITCVDGLTGFSQAIEAVFPQTEIQQFIIHQIRNTARYVSYEDSKKVMADLKLVYAAPTEETALEELEAFGEKWNSKYPKIYKSWNERWATLATYFKYPEQVRKLIYTQMLLKASTASSVRSQRAKRYFQVMTAY